MATSWLSLKTQAPRHKYMHVLYAFPEPLPLPRARGVQVAHTLASLLEEGQDVSLAYTPEDGAPDPLGAYELHPGSELKKLSLSRRASGLLGILPLQSNRFFNQRLVGWLRHEQAQGCAPDAIMTRHLKTAFALLKAKTGIPVIYEAHEVFALSAREKHRKSFLRMESFVLRHAARVIAISEALAAALAEHHGIDRDFDILHSGADLPAISTDKPWPASAQHIIYTGSLFGWKGVEDLVAATRWLPQHRVTIIGGTLDEIARLREQLPDDAEVTFKPQIPHAEIQAELAGACIAVLPNRAGSISAWTSPLKLFEYMGAGCAVVASDLPSIREILSPDEAMLVPPQDPRALAEAIRTLTDNPERTAAMGRHLRERTREFTWAARGKRLVAILNEAVHAA
jgi:glycosyltransferase involved in cell wall biosynthesis